MIVGKIERNVLPGSVVTEGEAMVFRLKEGRFRLDTRKMLFYDEGHWNRLPEEVVDALSLFQGQVVRGFKQLNLVKDVPTHGR